MRVDTLLVGALLVPAALLQGQDGTRGDPVVQNDQFQWFQLTEKKSEIAKAMGQPSLIAGFGRDYRAWLYKIDISDHDEFSHWFVFRDSDNRLVSVTRTYDPEHAAAELFPDGETTVQWYPNRQNPQYRLLARRLPGGRILMAMGISDRRQPVAQVVLMLESELRVFYPWLAEQLAAAQK